MATIFEVYIANALTELGLTDLIPIGQTPGTPADAGISFSDLLQQLSKGYSFRNLLIDGAFMVNQRGYVSAATLASGDYGHDRWKAGASGGDYSFTQLPNATQITIAGGKSLIQVVEDKNVVGGDYVLSWEGTAQGRYAVDSDTPAGAYADSPIAISSQTAGTTMSVEFDDGTLGKVQLESGAVATEFEHLPYDVNLARCQRYFQEVFIAYGSASWNGGEGRAVAYFQTEMRVQPDTSGTNAANSGFPAAVGSLSPTVRHIIESRTGSADQITAYFQSNVTLNSEL